MKKKLSKVLVLMIVVAFALTGCFGGSDSSDIINGDNGSDEVELENSYTEVSSYFTFDYPADWKVVYEDYYEETSGIDIVVNVSNQAEIEELDLFIGGDFNVFIVNYLTYYNLRFDNAEEFENSIAGIADKEIESIENDHQLTATIKVIERNNYQIGGQPGYRILVEVTNIFLDELENLGDLEMDKDEFEEMFKMDYDEYLNNGFDGFVMEKVFAYHNNYVHEISYMSGLDNYSGNLSEKLFDSFNFAN